MSEIDAQALKAEVEELRRSLTRISYVGMGLSPQLDKALNQLRQSLKDQASSSEIHDSVEKISNLLREIDEPRNPQVADLSAEVFIEELLQQPLPARLKSQLKQTESNLETPRDVAEAMARAIENYAAKIQQSTDARKADPGKLETVKAAPQAKSNWLKKLWQRLFARSAASETPAQQVKESPAISMELRATLLTLAKQMARMDAQTPMAKQLLKRVQKLQSHDDLIELLQFIAAAFCQFMGDEQRQFEQFLQQIAARIEYINTFINATLEHEASSHKAHKDLEGEIKEQVVDIHQSLASSQSLDAVKQAVASKVDTIVERVNLFVLNQSKRRKAYQAKVKKLRQELQQTQQESENLKQALKQQRQKALTDPLTKLANRYAYNERMAQELTRWQRYQKPLSYALLDIDHFKQINDRYGHDVGDEVLVQVANLLKSRLRESDFVARFGGEEFVIVMPETELLTAIKVMNKLRQQIAAQPVLAQGQSITVTASFGVTEFADKDTIDSVFSRADKALYRAKDKGRNQVCAQRSS